MDALLLKPRRSFETGNISRFHKANIGKLNIHNHLWNFCQAPEPKVAWKTKRYNGTCCVWTQSLRPTSLTHTFQVSTSTYINSKRPVCHGIPGYPPWYSQPCSSATSLFAPPRRLVQCLPTVVRNAVATSDIGHASWRSTWWCLPWRPPEPPEPTEASLGFSCSSLAPPPYHYMEWYLLCHA